MSVSYKSRHSGEQETGDSEAIREGGGRGGSHNDLCKPFLRVNIFFCIRKAEGLPKNVGQNNNNNGFLNKLYKPLVTVICVNYVTMLSVNYKSRMHAIKVASS